MIVILDNKASTETKDKVRRVLIAHGCEVKEINNLQSYLFIIEKEWDAPPADLIAQIRSFESVEHIHTGTSPHPIITAQKDPIEVLGFRFGCELALIAGPCTVEDSASLIEIANLVKNAGATMLRGGAFKPTTSPYSFSGHGEMALEALHKARDITGLGIVSEVMDPRLVSKVAGFVDVIQIGARNMQNYPLLKEVAITKKPILLKRSFGATIREWLLAAEHIAKHGNNKIILCERGIRTFENSTRATLDITAISIAKSKTRLPVIADPSHAAGDRRHVRSLSLAAVAAGASGLLVEVHKNPEESIKDGRQSINIQTFSEIVYQAKTIFDLVNQKQENKVKII